MQFEDISSQVIRRSKEDLLTLDNILRDYVDGRAQKANADGHEAIETRIAAHELEALHRPEQANLEPGEIELF